MSYSTVVIINTTQVVNVELYAQVVCNLITKLCTFKEFQISFPKIKHCREVKTNLLPQSL